MTISGLPWRISEAGINATDDAVIVNNSGDEVLGTSEWVRVDQTDLEYIVRAVNAHDALVAALETVRGHYVSILGYDEKSIAVEYIDDALAAARK